MNIQADYYFGGPVANASVEVVVYQNPFYHYWYPASRLSLVLRRHRAAAGPLLLRRPGPDHQTRNDQDRRHRQGHAHLRYAARELQPGFRISHRSARHRFIAARDHRAATPCASRASATTSIRAREHNIYRPKDKVTVDIKALDANEQPVTDRRHGQSHARLLVGNLARSERPRSEGRRTAAAARKDDVSAAAGQRSKALAAEVSRLSTRRHSDPNGEDGRRRRRRN